MDSMRGNYGTLAESGGYEPGDDDSTPPPPPAIGQDERRMQVRAYNHWASLLEDRNFPAIEDLEPDNLPDFGPYSVLLDFSTGIENPGISYLGDKLSLECGVGGEELTTLSDVPARSLLTRITDHYMQILANQAPIGFEAEFVNQRGATIMYRGILLPYSSDDDTIDFIYGVINWKEIADQLTSDELLLEIDQALETDNAARTPDPVTDWADGPGAAPARIPRPALNLAAAADPFPLPAFGAEDEEEEDDVNEEDALELDELDEGAGDLYEAIEAVDDEPAGSTRFASLLALGGAKVGRTPIDLGEAGIPGPDDEFGDDDFGNEDYTDQEAALAAWQMPRLAAVEPPHYAAEAAQDVPVGDDTVATFVPPAGQEHEVAAAEFDAYEVAAEIDEPPMGLHDCLAAARELALAARSCEDRSRSALYAAVGRAYDFSLAAQDQPEAFAELIADSGLTVQERAPMTPVVKLVFGADYDKTRLTEYAAVLSHAHRMGVERGTLAKLLTEAEGGLKGVVQAERDYRRADGAEVAVRETPREALARKLRAIAPLGFEDIADEGEEFALVMIRRVEGKVVVLGEIAD